MVKWPRGYLLFNFSTNDFGSRLLFLLSMDDCTYCSQDLSYRVEVACAQPSSFITHLRKLLRKKVNLWLSIIHFAIEEQGCGG